MDSGEAHKQIFQRSIVSVTGEYGLKQLKMLEAFMHADFPHWEVGGGRYNTLTIECPHPTICSPEEWKDSLDKIVLPEWNALDPSLKKQKLVIRFVPTTTDYKNNIQVGGHGEVVKVGGNIEYWYRIPILDSANNLRREQDLLFTVIHELAETDFWKKTSPSELITLLAEDKKSIELLKARKDNEYEHLTDETIANRRAWRALKRKWPNIQNEGIITYPIADVDM